MQRKIMNDETWRLVSSLDTKKMDAFEISGSKWRDAPWRSYGSAEFPDVEIDVRPYPGSFDIVLAEQVSGTFALPSQRGFERARHVEGRRVSTYYDAFSDSGAPHPTDCTRWTAEGLRCLLQDCDLTKRPLRWCLGRNLAAVIAEILQMVAVRRLAQRFPSIA